MNKVKLTSYIPDVQRDIKKGEKRALTKAAAHVRKAIHRKIDSVGIKKRSGRLKKGVVYSVSEHGALVGFGPKAYHAHLIEFGTKSRETKKGKKTGHVRPTPILGPVMEEEANAVMEILTDRFLE